MNTTNSVTVRELTEAEARCNFVVLRVPVGDFKPGSRKTVFPDVVEGLTFETARAVVSELNAIRIKAEAFGLWHFVRQSQCHPLHYAVCAAPSNGAQRWIPTGPLDLPPCVVQQGETFEAATAAVRDGNDRIWEVTSSPKVWHTMALLLAVPVLNVPAVDA